MSTKVRSDTDLSQVLYIKRNNHPLQWWDLRFTTKRGSLLRKLEQRYATSPHH